MKSSSTWIFVCVLLSGLAACGRDLPPGADEAGGRAGVITVLLDAGYSGSWPSGLDPATNTTARANLSLMNSIFGGLFQLSLDDATGQPTISGVLAEGYEITDDGRTILIFVRKGVVFSDGTAVDAEALRFNIERNLRSACTCAPNGWPWKDDEPVSVHDEHTVSLNFTHPYPAAINAFPVSNINWIVSPSALAAAGEEQFRVSPVGAGPFRVVSNTLSSALVLERNPLYWKAGHPRFERLIFRSIGSEQAALQALLVGDAQVYEGASSVSILALAEESGAIQVTVPPATSPYVIQLNTTRPPLDDQRAREAIYYATDPHATVTGLFGGRFSVTESFTGPGGLFHRETIPGYRRYDPEKARALVEELGGLRVSLGTIRSFVPEQIVTALQSQWREVGIDVSIHAHELGALIREFESGTWQAMLQTTGSYDPANEPGVSFRFHSTGTYSGVRDPVLDDLLTAAGSTFDDAERERLYFEAAVRISEKAYAPFLFSAGRGQLVVDGVTGPGLTTEIPAIAVNTAVLWDEVRVRGYEREGP